MGGRPGRPPCYPEGQGGQAGLQPETAETVGKGGEGTGGGVWEPQKSGVHPGCTPHSPGCNPPVSAPRTPPRRPLHLPLSPKAPPLCGEAPCPPTLSSRSHGFWGLGGGSQPATFSQTARNPWSPVLGAGEGEVQLVGQACEVGCRGDPGKYAWTWSDLDEPVDLGNRAGVPGGSGDPCKPWAGGLGESALWEEGGRVSTGQRGGREEMGVARKRRGGPVFSLGWPRKSRGAAPGPGGGAGCRLGSLVLWR